ncbi:MAG: SGNH/GDSL hydrolase family protein [Eubacteriales bacterium]|nr:SGNH/GDSL hydrolase family protein [Eubacteriales bacterium]
MKKRVLCFGDSNTWGYRAEDGSRYDDDVRWTGILQRLLGEDYTVIEEGQNGRTTVWDDPVENRLAGLTYLWPCMESHYPFDLLVIMLGTNDTKVYFGVEAQSIADSAGRLVDLARKSAFGRNGKRPKVLLVSPIRMKETGVFAHAFGKQAVEKTKGFSEVFRATAEKFGCDFLDAAEFAEPCETDGVHLDETGHEKLAKAMAEKIREILD